MMADGPAVLVTYPTPLARMLFSFYLLFFSLVTVVESVFSSWNCFVIVVTFQTVGVLGGKDFWEDLYEDFFPLFVAGKGEGDLPDTLRGHSR